MQHGTKTSPVFFPANGKASGLLLPSSNQSCLKPFGLSLHWDFCNPKQVVGKVGDTLFEG